jgi:cell fate regulator YaaT (PSP1 superfamily)
MYAYIRLFVDNSIKIGELSEGTEIYPGDYLLVETKYGTDIARSLSKELDLPQQNVKNLIKIISKAEEKDIAIYRENEEKSKQYYNKVKDVLKKHLPKINFIRIYFLLDKSKVLVYYTSDERVDFREAVKELASIFRIRIEMRQIDNRESFRMMGGIGICGMKCCCSNFDVKNEHISVNLVKEQSLSETNAKLIGPCGKLLCCLSYEQENYKDGKCIIYKNNTNDSIKESLHG